MYQTRGCDRGSNPHKSRKSWKSRQKLKAGLFHALPRIAHSPFITKLERSPISLDNTRFNWNDSWVRSREGCNCSKWPETAFGGNFVHWLRKNGQFWLFEDWVDRSIGCSTLIVNQSRRETYPSQWTSSTASVKWASCAKNTAMYFLLKAALLLFLQAGKRMHTGSTTIREIHLIHSRRKYFEAIKYFVLCWARIFILCNSLRKCGDSVTIKTKSMNDEYKILFERVGNDPP